MSRVVQFGTRFLVAMAISLPVCARSDVIYLKSGGQLEGQVIDDDDASATQYVVETDLGGRITLARSQVARIDRQSDLDARYRERARAAPDTAESHWQLAEWCRENRLTEQSEQHLGRVVELDPHHAEARNLLGYRQVQGHWLTRDQLMAGRGLVLHRGKYRSAQEIALLERNEKISASVGEWRARVQRWRRRLTDRQPERAIEARRNIESIRDPAAADALVELLKNEDVYDVKLLLLAVLSRFEHQVALDALVSHALYDPSDEVRAQSLEYLIKSERPGISAPFVRALRSSDNAIVNRAARALQDIGDPTAVGPLITALVTEHKFVQGSGAGGNHNYSFDGSGAMTFGNSGPRITKQKLRNPAVLSALVALTGGRSFDYDQPRWRAWLAGQKDTIQIDMRRDE